MLRYLCSLSLLIFSLYSLLAQEAAKPRLQGLLWEISGNGIAKNGYLYGTMHVPRKLAFNLSDTFFLALQKVDIVALETNHDEWQSFSKDMENFERSQQQNLIRSADFYDVSIAFGNFYPSYFNFQAPQNDELGALLSTKPNMSNELMYRSSTYGQEYEEDTYLDQFIFQSGKKLGKTVIGLENLAESYSASLRSRIPDEDADEDKYKYRRYGLEGIEEAYRTQDLTALDSLNQLTNPSKNFQKYMLDIRNVVHADGIDSILRSGKAIFAGIGAAHLPGETGVIALLKERGYTMRPVIFTMSSRNIDLKNNLENLRYPVEMTTFSPKDSTWSAAAPGPFFKSDQRSGVEQYLCADMANGAYYAVYRMKTNGIWNGQNSAYMAERIDSLIYESTPGKIQERTRFNDPVPGHSITTRTRRGDIQRFKLYVLPNEILLFSTGGIGDFALSKEAATFLESIKIKPFSNESKVFSPLSEEYSITFPAPMIGASANEPASELHSAAAYSIEQDAYYSVYRVHYPDYSYIEEDSFELNIISEEIADKFTKTPPKTELISLHPYPTQDFSFQSDADSSYYFGRILIHGSAYYLLTCRKKDATKPTEFFESFHLKEATYGQAFSTHIDSTLKFSILTVPQDSIVEKPFFKEFSAIIKEISSKNMEIYGRNEDVSKQKTGAVLLYDKDRTQEIVYVLRDDIKNLAFIPSVDSFQNFVRNLVTDDDNMVLEKEEWTSKGDNYLEAEFTVSDTNSNRGILHKIIAQNGSIYRLVALQNLDTEPSLLVKKAFESFQSTDTAYAALTFGKRDVSFLENLYATDSLIAQKARLELKQHGRSFFEKQDYRVLKNAILHPDFDSLSYEEKDYLLNACGGVESRASVDFLKKFYVSHPDSARLRVASLTALSYIKTDYGYKTFFDILSEGNAYLGMYFSFSSAKDNLDLTAKFAKQFVRLYENPQYKTLSVNILQKMYSKKLIKAKTFKSLKKPLARSVAQAFAERQYRAEKARQSENEYTSFSTEMSASLCNEIALLKPFIQKDKNVRSLFDYVLKHGDPTSRLAVYSLYLKEGLAVPETQIKSFAGDKKTEYMAFSALAEAQQLSKFAYLFSDTLSLVESLAFKEEGDLDSLKFLSKHKAVFDSQPATLYFFDAKAKKTKEWGLLSVTVPNDLATYLGRADSENSTENYRSEQHSFTQAAFSIEESKKEEFIKKKIEAIRFVGRKRYLARRSYDY